ncbi:hypothetical protein CR513_04685, partial [Mucuna pruriens]
MILFSVKGILKTYDITVLANASAVAGTGKRHAESAKLRQAYRPLRAIAATSCARAAISGVGKVPSQILVFLLGSLTSHTHLSEFLFLTPRYTGWRVSRNFFRPARFFGCLTARRTSSSENATPREPSDSGDDVSKEEECSEEAWYTEVREAYIDGFDLGRKRQQTEIWSSVLRSQLSHRLLCGISTRKIILAV